MPIKRAVKSRVLPHGRSMRRLPVGLGRGLRMGVDFQRGETRLYLGLYEVELNRHLRRIAKPGYRSFDIGGQYGYDALVLAKLTGAPVLSVESEPELAVEIRENAAANPGLPSIEVVTGFVSDDAAGDHVTIDDLAAEHFVPDLIKLDIEGGEVAALRGAARVLEDRRPAIQLEVHGKEIEWECLAILRAAGYEPPTVVDRRRWLPEHRPIDHNRWLIFEG
ncbi:FkbM family methyltransferase [Nocardioides sp. CPCC 205120]|uniref:FkbM family methyltransferase n=1 Tax=Nocardioides sp. CPCC 205120 TaxID=3406462 RepID=UPI003B5031A9